EPHGVETYSPLRFLLGMIFVEEVRRRVDHVVQEANRVTDGFAEIVPNYFAVADELREIDRAQVADSKARKRLLAARVCAAEVPPVVVPGVRHFVGAFDEEDARLSRGPRGFDYRVPD